MWKFQNMKNTESVNFRWKSIFAYSMYQIHVYGVLFGWCLYICSTQKFSWPHSIAFPSICCCLLCSVFFWLLVRCKWYYIFKSCAFIWFSQKRCFIVLGVVHVSVNMCIHVEEAFVGLFPPFAAPSLYKKFANVSVYIVPLST